MRWLFCTIFFVTIYLIFILFFLFFVFIDFLFLIFFFFFFQAEDGIRDGTVTGVQTCALPICPGSGAVIPRCRIKFRDLSHCAGPRDIPLQFPPFRRLRVSPKSSSAPLVAGKFARAHFWRSTLGHGQKGGRTAETPPSRSQPVRPPVPHPVQRF